MDDQSKPSRPAERSITSIITSLSQYPTVLRGLQDCSEPDRIARLRNLCRTDLYFLLRYGLNRADAEKQWLFERCREVQATPDGMLDLWAREHYKSTIITYALTIQNILADADITVGIFSHTRPIAKAFLRQIKREFESNENLKAWFPDVLWADPHKEAPKWSEDEGITVRRRSNPKEATVEAWGLVDGQPTSKHFRLMVYDDVVTRESVTTPDQIKKTTEAMELSYNLGAQGGTMRAVGTRYHFNDTYRTLSERGTFLPRIYKATTNGQVDGEPVLLTREQLAKKRRDQGPYTFGCQMLQDPKADETQGFKPEWLRFYERCTEPERQKMRAGMTVYILVDPANDKKRSSDYSSYWVIGLNADKKKYALDIVRDRLNLTERGKLLLALHRLWKPHEVRYEHYGMQADVQYITDLQDRENYRFVITEVGGSTPKPDRIKRLIPGFERGEIYLPRTLWKTNYEGGMYDAVQVFIDEEFSAFPVASHDDMLDGLARIEEPELPLAWPSAEWSGALNYGNRSYV